MHQTRMGRAQILGGRRKPPAIENQRTSKYAKRRRRIVGFSERVQRNAYIGGKASDHEAVNGARRGGGRQTSPDRGSIIQSDEYRIFAVAHAQTPMPFFYAAVAAPIGTAAMVFQERRSSCQLYRLPVTYAHLRHLSSNQRPIKPEREPCGQPTRRGRRLSKPVAICSHPRCYPSGKARRAWKTTGHGAAHRFERGEKKSLRPLLHNTSRQLRVTDHGLYPAGRILRIPGSWPGTLSAAACWPEADNLQIRAEFARTVSTLAITSHALKKSRSYSIPTVGRSSGPRARGVEKLHGPRRRERRTTISLSPEILCTQIGHPRVN